MIKLLRYIFVALLPSSSMAMNLLGQKTEVGKNSSVVVLYSGGLDSSAVAALLAAKGIKNIHLITCDNGAQDHLKYAEFKLDDFRQKFPETNFIHTYQESRYPFKKFALIDIESDIKKYTTNLVCVGCKLAMHGVAIVYALKPKL